VLDDSEADLAIFKMKIKLDDYDVRYFTDPSRMMNEYTKALILGRDPSCVVVDYYLSEHIRGDEVLHFFKNNSVPTVIVTGYEGRISNITERDIIYKSVEDSYFLSVENWIASATGRV
jgi:FixJ family two-component response regulator